MVEAVEEVEEVEERDHDDVLVLVREIGQRLDRLEVALQRDRDAS